MNEKKKKRLPTNIPQPKLFFCFFVETLNQKERKKKSLDSREESRRQIEKLKREKRYEDVRELFASFAADFGFDFDDFGFAPFFFSFSFLFFFFFVLGKKKKRRSEKQRRWEGRWDDDDDEEEESFRRRCFLLLFLLLFVFFLFVFFETTRARFQSSASG